MLAFGNKEFRNLQEQVLENMRQIDDIKQAAVVLDEFGIKVIGQIESADELPDPETYEGEFGDAYAVGTEAPYELYIWTRGDSLGNNAYWFDIGAFPQAGPQGEQGPRGEQGPSGTIAFGSMSVTTTEPGTNANVSFTNIGTATNAVYNLSWYIPRGAQGIPGETGATGATGATGPQGPKGDKGDTGTGYIIMGQLDSELDLPDPGSTDRQAAYLVGAHEPYDLYVIVGLPGHLEWFDSGSFTTAEADISQFEAGYGLSLGQIDDKIAYAVDTSVIPVFQDLSDLAWNINASVANTYATKASLSSFQSEVNSAFTSVYASLSEYAKLSASVNTLAGDLEVGGDLTLVGYLKQPVSGGYVNVFELPSESGKLALVSEIPSLYGYATESYVNDQINELSSVYATPAQVSSAVGQLDYASVGALSSATVIPDITGLASESYVDDSIASLSSVYASISDIPDMSEYATVSQVSSAISALNYASVGALSSNTYIPPTVEGTYDSQYWATLTIDGTTRSIPSLAGYATETYVQNELSGYAKESALSNYTPLSQMSLYASVSAVESAISGVNSTISSLDYTSVGALSAATVIPDVTGLASVSYVNNSISALSSVYAPLSDYASQAWVSANFLSSGAIPSISGYAELASNNTFTGTNQFVYSAVFGANSSAAWINSPTTGRLELYGRDDIFMNGYAYFASAASFKSTVWFSSEATFSSAINLWSNINYCYPDPQQPGVGISCALTLPSASGILVTEEWVNSTFPKVMGSYSGSYWTDITIGSITKEIPQGGGVSGDYVPTLMQDTDDPEDPEDPTFTHTGEITNSSTEIYLDVNAEYPDQPGTNKDSTIIIGQEDIYISHSWEEMISRENPDYDPEDPISEPTWEDSVSLEKYLTIDTNDFTIHNMHWDDAVGDTVDESYGLLSVARNVNTLNSTISGLGSIYAPLSSNNTFTGSNTFTKSIAFGSDVTFSASALGIGRNVLLNVSNVYIGSTIDNRASLFQIGANVSTSFYGHVRFSSNTTFGSSVAFSQGKIYNGSTFGTAYLLSLPTVSGYFVAATNLSNSAMSAETWTFTLSDNTTVTKKILVG